MPPTLASAFLAKDEAPSTPQSAAQPPLSPSGQPTMAAAFLASTDPAPPPPEPPPPSTPTTAAAAFLASTGTEVPALTAEQEAAAAAEAEAQAAAAAQAAAEAEALAAAEAEARCGRRGREAAAAAAAEAETAAALAAAAAAHEEPPIDDGGSGLRIHIDVHALRLDEAARLELLELSAKRLWVEVSMEPSVLLPVPLKTARVDLPTKSTRKTDKVTELPVTLSGGTITFPERSASGRALAKALAAADPTAACVRLALYGIQPPSKTASKLCEAPISLQQLLRRSIALKRQPLQLYATDDGRPIAALLVTLDALTALKTLVPTPLPPPGVPPPMPTPAAGARTTSRTPAGASTEAADSEKEADTKPSPLIAPSVPPAASAPLAPEAEAALLATMQHLPKLPIRLDLTIESVELGATVTEDPSITRVQLAVDLMGLSEGALMTDRMRKPPPSTKTVVNHKKLVPIYDATYAAKCMRAAASAAASAVASAAKEADQECKEG